MKRILVFTFFVAAFCLPCLSQTEPPKQFDRQLWCDPQVMPSYPGGPKALQDFIHKNLRWPRQRMQDDMQGRVVVSFTVTKSGRCRHFKVMRSLDPDYDREAIRVLRKMPRWQPGTINGRRVNVKYVVPVRFQRG